jgi:hypothetical protein
LYEFGPTSGSTAGLGAGKIEAAASAPLWEALANRKGLVANASAPRKEKAMNVVPVFELEVFGPDEIKAMLIALDEVCSKFGLADDKQEEREVLAKRIIALARRGERNPAALRDGVLRELAVRAWRGMSYSESALPR